MKKIYDYNLTKFIGRGAFGEVYLATKNNTNQYFAVKKIHEGLLEEKQRKYLRNEVQILEKLKKLKHPNIVIFYQTIKKESYYYFITEYINGGSLSNCLEKYRKKYKRPFSEEIIQYLMKQIVNALVYIHGSNIIHRDLKSENIMINFKSEEDKQNLNLMNSIIKIIDFGFSVELPSNNSQATSIVGTPLYMDPKILENLLKQNNPQLNANQSTISYGKEVDLWSLGCICYELLIGKSIFDAQNLDELVNQVKQQQYFVNARISSEYFDFLSCLLQYNGEFRLNANQLSKHPFLTQNIKNFKILHINDVIKNKKFDQLKTSIDIYKKLNKKKGEDKKKYKKFPSSDHVVTNNMRNIINKNNVNVGINRSSTMGGTYNIYGKPMFINPNQNSQVTYPSNITHNNTINQFSVNINHIYNSSPPFNVTNPLINYNVGSNQNNNINHSSPPFYSNNNSNSNNEKDDYCHIY